MANLAGQKTFLEAQQEVSETVLSVSIAVDGSTGATNPNLTRVKAYLNDAYREICSEEDWWFLFDTATIPTVAAQETPYALDDLAIDIRYMTIAANQQKLSYLPWETWINQYPGRFTNVGNTRPWAYVPAEPATNNALQVMFFPAADAIYTVEYGFKKRVTNLTSNTHIPMLPPEFQDVWIAKAIHKCFVKLGDEKAKYWSDYYEKRMNEMWIKNEQMSDYVNKFRYLDDEGASSGDVNRALFVPF